MTVKYEMGGLIVCTGNIFIYSKDKDCLNQLSGRTDHTSIASKFYDSNEQEHLVTNQERNASFSNITGV